MARKSDKNNRKPTRNYPDAFIENGGVVVEDSITDTLKKNYMPYAMSVIVSRALPEIDGFKPSHRKLLYTMYKQGLLTGKRTKSANVVGETMKLNPHGDGAIYETMVRLARGNETLLYPYVDSKGNFGKAYSRDMAYAASRYTEVKLEAICTELFSDIDKDTVDFVPNYDNTTTEPTLFPTTFPTILVNSNMGIAVSMASNICPFNLAEVCDTCIACIKNPEHDIISTLKGPDFPGGGFMLYDEDELREIYRTGRGSIKLRSKYNYDKSANCIEVTQIPYSTTIEAIIEKIIELIKQGKIKEISYIRDETDLNGLKIAIDLKRGVDPDKLMNKLFKLTPLQDNFSCNFNILIGGVPKVMGVREILDEWLAFREECVKRRVFFDLNKSRSKLHLLKGLEKILLDIDKAIRIVRETEEESDVVPNLMTGFGIDEIQAEYVAEIKLRHLNREYIMNRLKEIENLENNIMEMEGILADKKKVRNIIITELKRVSKKYAKPRNTMFFYKNDIVEPDEEETPDYPVNIFLSESGYFKKITPQSLRMSGEQKLKEGDRIAAHVEASNKSELLFFTDKCQVYKAKASAFEDTKASVMGDFIPAKLGFDEGEALLYMTVTNDFTGYMLFFFKNGKAAKVPLDSYETKTNRKKLANAYSGKQEICTMMFIKEDALVSVRSTAGKMLIFNTALLLPKASRDTIGVQVMTLKGGHTVESAAIADEEFSDRFKKHVSTKIPVAGIASKELMSLDQMKLE
ncbi:MAG: DNA topoisomerase (ATP-hydrolyzing) subunit A [Clostridium sp.]|nr:DNA topoisomerase (ATP-hydrolyzing) subunit A [Clostridium sp.]MCM1546817.1 DNA topoisomerase (ATP-hydrolyzing) subunit A [Ruminococcus sp.]